MEVSSRLEKVLLKLDVALDVNRANRRSKLSNFGHKLLLCRRRKIHARRRTQSRCEKVQIVLDSDALDRFLGEFFSFLGHGLFVGQEPPKPNPNQSQHDDEQGNYLPR